MHVEIAEISCLICSRGLGSVQRRGRRLQHVPAMESPSSATLIHNHGGGLVCGCCGGKAIIGPFERVPVYAYAALGTFSPAA